MSSEATLARSLVVGLSSSADVVFSVVVDLKIFFDDFQATSFVG